LLRILSIFLVFTVVSANANASKVLSTHMEGLLHRIKSKKTESRLDEIFNKLRSTYGFNGAVLISEKDHVIYRKAFGYSDLQSRQELNTKSIFQLASVSKQFTAVAIMMLKSRGLLKYEDKVTKFFPNFPWREVTIRHLLNHRSGIPDYRWFLDPLMVDKNKPVSNQEMMRQFAIHKPDPYFSTGAHYAYSNSGYAVLAAIVEKLSGTSFSNFMKLAVFEPLGMKHSYVYSKCEKQLPPNAVKGYERNGAYEAPNDAFNGITGDKNVYSTVEDLFLWDQALYTNKLLPQRELLEAFQPGNPELKGYRNYGFGWRINQHITDKKIVYHSGWWRGFRTFFLRNLNDHSTIIILSNTVNYSINSLGELYSLIMKGEVDSLVTEY
jgi:CubicO group peptidase (beta-lactamase class C family)